jgi:hypothetical protein
VVYIGAGATVEAKVYFTPSVPGECSTILYVFYGRDNWEEVVLAGTGIGIPTTKQQMTVNDVLGFFDDAVDDGYLKGSGRGKSADNRLRALRKMIEVVGSLIGDELIDEACDKLQSICKKIDGLDKPQDFAEGDYLSALHARLQEIMVSIGCK